MGVKELTKHIIANITKQTLSLKIKYKNFCYLDFLLKGVLTWWLNLQINELYFLSSKKRHMIKSNQTPLNQTSKMTFSFHKLCNHRRIKSIWKQQARQIHFPLKHHSGKKQSSIYIAWRKWSDVGYLHHVSSHDHE